MPKVHEPWPGANKELYRMVGRNIRHYRIQRGLRIEEVTAALNMGANVLYNIETQGKGVSLSFLVAIANLLNVTLDELVYGPKTK